MTKEQPESLFRKAKAGLQTHLEFGDLLLFIYALVLVRQYFWIIDSNTLGWILSILVTAVCWYFYVSTKQFPAQKFGLNFWLVVGLPLLAAYLLRAAFPDRSYDVLTYHLLHAERSLRGSLFMAGDFFPSPVAVNPAPDTLAGISRLILGFRLGTVINLLALLWAAQAVDKILRPLVARPWIRSGCVLLAFIAENLFFEISTYMIDLLALPLMLEATVLTLKADEAENSRANFVHIALLLGASTAFKLTNLAVAIPLVAIAGYTTLVRSRGTWSRKLATVAIALMAFVATIFPFCIYIFRLTGNPLFPVANIFFKSPYWPTNGGWDNRFGPHTLWETVAWPVLVWFKPERHSELALYSGRLSLAFVVAIVGLPLVWRHARARLLCFILIASAFLWSAAATGNSRYGLYQEVLAGVTVVVVASVLIKRSTSITHWQTVVAAILFLVLVVQAVFALSYTLRTEWGGRTTLIRHPDLYFQEAKLMLRDHSLPSFLSEEDRALFEALPTWLETCPETTGFEVLINPNAPIIAARQPEYFFTRQARRRFIQVVGQAREEKMFTLCLSQSLPVAKEAIALRGLRLGRMTPIDLPFFSHRERIGMMLIEVLSPQEPEARNNFESSWMNAAFPDSDYREEITAIAVPTVMKVGQKLVLRFRVKNLGSSSWPGVGNEAGRYQVNIGDRWLDATGMVEINGADGRTAMNDDLLPGKEIELPITVAVPQKPGDYTLEIDMVHEGVTWFYERGAQPLRLRIHVEP